MLCRQGCCGANDEHHRKSGSQFPHKPMLKPGVDSRVKVCLSSRMGALLSIGKVAAISGTTPDTIRYYERRGLLPKPTRTAGGYRQYPDGVLNRLSLVRNAQRFGFSLAEIAGFLQIREAGGRPCHDVRAAAQRMLIAVDAQIADLMSTRKRMQHTLRNWDRTLRRTPSNQQARLLERLSPPESRPSARHQLLRRRD
jgi:MerR family copper efflux transcriptional regulator